ncbi:RagB/SusD family nutrient uptake outer membrane protein [Flavobacterium hydatis]|uniref:RagB/SusD family nutrient uptake outer membrane protein n=1 Tax=Flavobacterium hydatis TaxID=991 RepID=A0A086A390_FLAHY|nr:RagB/SusD family nutrient uptake outer membrane protein [Flavobacterium hydatis]KFF11154.1 starch-binding protein [Flavobacterium hydatis]OXA97813.1 RagB/SusD family nutrient uptake outer membrane protein [Flavobacterium hydatis]
MKNSKLLQGLKHHRNYNLRTLFLFVVCSMLSCFATGCDNFVDVDLPTSQLNAEDVFKDKVTANAAMVDIYTKIRENGLLTGGPSGISSQLGLYTDELKFYGVSNSGQANFYNNSLLASDTEILDLWTSSYNQIYSANAIIEGVSISDVLESKDKDQLMGEALFVRGLIHLYLTNVFGNIPFIITTDYKQNSIVHRMSENEVYNLIKKDLEQASKLLPEEYIGSERVRPNKWASQALLARVCLYLQQWDEASDAASSVLNQTDLYIWSTDLSSVFLKGSTATIWQLMPAIDGMNTHEAETFVFTQGPPSSLAISYELVKAFTTQDLRKGNWLKAVTDGTSIWYHANKYKERSNTGSSVEYSIVLRMAEQYLIRAEARAHQGDIIGAKEDLDKTRNLAGLNNTSATNAEEIITEVLIERRLEFFTELGHRFFDLKRTGRLDTSLSSVKPQWGTTDRLLPIPESELLLNPNLAPQNAGY